MPLVRDVTDTRPAGTPRGIPAEISLTFSDDVVGQTRSRMLYAFRVFAGIYGYAVVEGGSGSAALRCVYGRSTAAARDPGIFFIPARYRLRPTHELPPPLLKHRYAGEELYLAYGLDRDTDKPDWLGEIFEWLSSSYETAAVKRDSVGRIPYSGTIFSRQGISPRRPHANLVMAWMQNAIQGSQREALPKSPSPVPGVDHIILCTHDIDFFYTGPKSALIRILKNLAISGVLYRSSSFLADNLWYLFQIIVGEPIGKYIRPLVNELERLHIGTTFFAVSRQGHRRDPAYDLEHIAPCLMEAASRGSSVALHGSYTSAVEDESLAEETQALSRAIERKILGGRQHWLRFDQHQKLFAQIESAGLIFDSSLGFPDVAGFRNGASFAFPPYDFQREAPCQFLEFPLALMDGSIEATCRQSGENPQGVADEVLGESRRWGWGGAAVLWHDPIESLQVPAEINRVFWNCARRQNEYREKWVSSDEFFRSCMKRYQDAGLLRTVTNLPLSLQTARVPPA